MVEMNIPLWTFSISQKLSEKIERVQRTAVYIILGQEAHRDYYRNLASLDLLPLKSRREDIATKCAQNLYKHPAHKTMFQTTAGNTRAGKHILIPTAKKARYENSSVPSMARILNRTIFRHH